MVQTPLHSSHYSDFRHNLMYIKYYVNAVRVVFLSLVPFILLIFFSVKIYKRFLRTRARYRRGSNTAQVCAFLLLNPFFKFCWITLDQIHVFLEAKATSDKNVYNF